MALRLPCYLVIGKRPVTAVACEDGGFDVLGYEWTTGAFVRDRHAWDCLFDGGIDAKALDAQAFRAYLADLKKVAATAPAEQFTAATFKRLINPCLKRDESGKMTYESLQAKVRLEYNGDASGVTNILHSSLVYETLDDFIKAPARASEALKQDGIEIVRVVDRYASRPIDGYPDILLNLRMPNQHVTQMDMHLQSMLDTRQRLGLLYEEQDALGRQRLEEDRPFSSYEARRIMELLEEQQAAYDKALAG